MIILDKVAFSETGFSLTADFAVPKGALCAVLGPSGAGKSTLLSVIAGLLGPVSGTITVSGQNVTGLPAALRPISMVFQAHNVFAHLDAWTNVALGISPSLKLTDAQNQDVDSALARVGLSQLARRKPGELSGGEEQRIALARILLRNRPVLLLDEPFDALDPGLRKQMLEMVRDLHEERGLTTMLVTHRPEDAKLLADAVIFVHNGLARPPVLTDTFFSNTESPEIRQYLG